MAVQTSYGFSPSRGVAGGLYDMSPRAVNSRTTESEIVFGIGLVQGSTPGTNVTGPASTSTAAVFEGIALNGGTQEMDMEGAVKVAKSRTVSVLRYGRAWVRVEPEAEVKYGDALYLITTGDNAGRFTNADSEESKIAVSGQFIGANTTDGIAPVELFNAPAPTPPAASDGGDDGDDGDDNNNGGGVGGGN